MTDTREVIIDGVRYRPETEMEAEAKRLLSQISAALWAEAYYDPFNDSTKRFAAPLADKMKRLNELLGFRK